MKFEKVTELCKKSRKFLIFKYSEKIYFLGTGNAMFVVPDGTICTPEYLTSFAGRLYYEKCRWGNNIYR